MDGANVTEGFEVAIACFSQRRGEAPRLKGSVTRIRRDSGGRIIELDARESDTGLTFAFTIDEGYLARRKMIRVDEGRTGEGKIFMMPPDDFGTGAYLIGQWPLGTTPKAYRRWVRVIVGDTKASYETMLVPMSPKSPGGRPSHGVDIFQELFGRQPRLIKRGPPRGDVDATVDAIAMRLLEAPGRIVIAGDWVKWSDVVKWTSDAGRETREEALRRLDEDMRLIERRDVKTAGRPGVEYRIVLPAN